MTESRTYEIQTRMGRKMQYPVRITLPLADGVTERIDALVGVGETRLDLIREAIDKEIRRRQRQIARSGKSPFEPGGTR